MNEWNLIVFFELLKYFGPSKMSLSPQPYSQTILLDLGLWKIGTMRHSVNISIGALLTDSSTFGKNANYHLTQTFNRLDLRPNRRGCDKNEIRMELLVSFFHVTFLNCVKVPSESCLKLTESLAHNIHSILNINDKNRI